MRSCLNCPVPPVSQPRGPSKHLQVISSGCCSRDVLRLPSFYCEGGISFRHCGLGWDFQALCGLYQNKEALFAKLRCARTSSIPLHAASCAGEEWCLSVVAAQLPDTVRQREWVRLSSSLAWPVLRAARRETDNRWKKSFTVSHVSGGGAVEHSVHLSTPLFVCTLSVESPVMDRTVQPYSNQIRHASLLYKEM